MKHIILLLGVLLCTVVNADDGFRVVGTVNGQSLDGSTIMINSQEYNLTLETVTHGMAMVGELGPLLTLGQVVSFSVENNHNDISYITEIWTQQ